MHGAGPLGEGLGQRGGYRCPWAGRQRQWREFLFRLRNPKHHRNQCTARMGPVKHLHAPAHGRRRLVASRGSMGLSRSTPSPLATIMAVRGALRSAYLRTSVRRPAVAARLRDLRPSCDIAALKFELERDNMTISGAHKLRAVLVVLELRMASSPSCAAVAGTKSCGRCGVMGRRHGGRGDI